MVFLDGVYQHKATYSVSGTILTFDAAPASGVLANIIEVQGATVISNEVIGLIKEVSEEQDSNDDISESEASEVDIPPPASPSVRKTMAENDLKSSDIEGSGKHGKILKEDLNEHLKENTDSVTEEALKKSDIVTALLVEDTLESQKVEPEESQISSADDSKPVVEKDVKEEKHTTSNIEPITMPTTDKNTRNERRVPMTRLRSRIAERLVEAQQTAAILTTFNDVDLSEIIRLRKIYRDRFERVHGIKLGFMSFFVKAATEALKRYPEVNARIDGQDIIYQGNYDIGVAVSTERGLVVPIVRDTNTLGHAEIEKNIHDYAHRARNNQLELNELTGGTFSITNGGVFGSMLSTPIINPPQSAILGMHKIEDRPVAINGEVVIRPMMYLALSYDHRLIDGKTAVSFLVKMKELLEDPASLFLEL